MTNDKIITTEILKRCPHFCQKEIKLPLGGSSFGEYHDVFQFSESRHQVKTIQLLLCSSFLEEDFIS